MPTKSKSSTITKTFPRRFHRYSRETPPIHPGEMLREDFLIPLKMTANALALAIGVPATRVSEIVNERRGISGDTALRLGRYFRMTAEYWMNMQSHYELELARYEVGKKIEETVRPMARAAKNSSVKKAA